MGTVQIDRDSGNPAARCDDPTASYLPLGWFGSAVAFGVPTLLLTFATFVVIPHAVSAGVQPLLAWFVAGGSLVFAPVLVAALLGARTRSKKLGGSLFCALRLRAMNRSDWLWTGVSFLAIGISSALLTVAGEHLVPDFTPGPPFMQVAPLGPDELWVLAAWLPFWLLNILGEELWWRGYLLPRQEVALGTRAWLVQGLLWGVFHASFGWGLIMVVAPTLFVIPWVVQRRGNTWIGVILHALINGPAFVMISLGYIRI